MTDTIPSLDALPLPHRVAIPRLLAEALRLERALADLYTGFRTTTPLAPLADALGELARMKTARAELLEPSARAWRDETPDIVGRPPSIGAASTPPVGAMRREDLFARAFQGERSLEVAYRELGSLLGDPARCPPLAGLLADTARQRARLTDLYLRYS